MVKYSPDDDVGDGINPSLTQLTQTDGINEESLSKFGSLGLLFV